MFIKPAEHCPYCITGKIGLKNNDSINNPIQAKCHNYKCTRNISLRKGTIFAFQSKTRVSILYKIIKFWISENKNAKQIKLKLEEEYHKETVNSKLIYETLTTCRKAIATYIRNIYQIERLDFTKSGTGKTSYVNKWTKNIFSDTYKATIVSEFGFKIFEQDGKLYCIQLWDLAGQDKNVMVTKIFAKDAHGCVVMSDATNTSTRDEQKILE